MEFSSLQELKTFLNEIDIFLHDKKIIPFRNFRNNGPLPLLDIEREIIIKIYNSYAGTNSDEANIEKSKNIKQISGKFFQLLQLLIPAENFTHIFGKLVSLEWQEHHIKLGQKRYRDHILHLANVCWAGGRLIFGKKKKEFPFHYRIKSSLEALLESESKAFLKTNEDWDDFIKITWLITAIVHDFGYPYELVGSKYYTETMNFENYLESHFNSSIPLFKKQVGKINSKLWKEPFTNNNKDRPHPIIVGLELLHFLDRNKEKFKDDKKWFRDVYQLAALGIFEHHTKNRIDFELNPFGYLLALADTMHEWERYINVAPYNHTPQFIAPIKKAILSKDKNKKNRFIIKYQINDDIKKFPGHWNQDEFINGKKKELNRLKSKTPPLVFDIQYI